MPRGQGPRGPRRRQSPWNIPLSSRPPRDPGPGGSHPPRGPPWDPRCLRKDWETRPRRGRPRVPPSLPPPCARRKNPGRPGPSWPQDGSGKTRSPARRGLGPLRSDTGRPGPCPSKGEILPCTSLQAPPSPPGHAGPGMAPPARSTPLPPGACSAGTGASSRRPPVPGPAGTRKTSNHRGFPGSWPQPSRISLSARGVPGRRPACAHHPGHLQGRRARTSATACSSRGAVRAQPWRAQRDHLRRTPPSREIPGRPRRKGSDGPSPRLSRGRDGREEAP